ncbi:DUF1059 domain-containing protein [Pseudonocardia benzenivorans]|uniref:DUF1059 domain-containing protein n=1 Tax=Pseudonocardia benzenivorans TaxID=228005 RepID=A0ABW3VBV1_9PSEU|nr:hypothetical protein PSD17_03290 [Pseudonocardia sp. D17]
MARVTLDCRSIPSESNCSLTISGEPDEVLRAAAAHAVDVHGHVDDDELRQGLRTALTEAAAIDVEPGAFVQLIEFTTDRIDAIADIEQEWLEAIGTDRTAVWGIVGADRSDPRRFVQVVGFPDAEQAAVNSKHPATSRIAEQLRALCDGDPVFRDLDVREVRAF